MKYITLGNPVNPVRVYGGMVGHWYGWLLAWLIKDSDMPCVTISFHLL